MMCSSWKISIFGIVALMLAFGLTTTDALAAKGAVSVTISGHTGLRAADETTLKFTVRATNTNPSDGDDEMETITIGVPTDWSSASYADTETVANNGDVSGGTLSVGEVAISSRKDSGTKTGDGEAKGFISATDNRKLVVEFGKDNASGVVVFAFRTAVPTSRKTYKFTVSTTGAARTVTAPVAVNEKHFFEVAVGAARSGTGTVTLSGGGGKIFKQAAPGDKVLPHEGRYIIISEADFTPPGSHVVVTYKAAAAMPKNSTVVLTLTSPGDPATWPLRRPEIFP